jgi:hypothetical protein
MEESITAAAIALLIIMPSLTSIDDRLRTVTRNADHRFRLHGIYTVLGD